MNVSCTGSREPRRSSWDVDAQLAALDELLALAARCGDAARRRSARCGSKLADRERLRDVVVGAELEAEHLVELLAARGQHDDRDVALTAKSLADLEPVEAGKHDVEHDEVDVVLLELPERLFAVARLDDRVAVPLERIRQKRLDRLLVVDEQDGRGAGHRKGLAGPLPAARLL
jgi:hypothetical protein